MTHTNIFFLGSAKLGCTPHQIINLFSLNYCFTVNMEKLNVTCLQSDFSKNKSFPSPLFLVMTFSPGSY